MNSSTLQRSEGNVPTTFGPSVKTEFQTAEPGSSLGTVDVKNMPISGIEFLAAYLRVPAEEIRVTSFYTDAHNGLSHVYFQQVIDGLEVTNGVANCNILKSGSVISVGSSFYTGPRPSPAELNRESAVRAVMALSNFLGYSQETSISAEVEINSGSAVEIHGAKFAKGKILAVPKYVQACGLRLVWSIEVDVRSSSYNALVDGESGEVISLVDSVCSTKTTETQGVSEQDKVSSLDFFL